MDDYRHASFLALRRLVELCRKERADLLLIAGDLVDAWDRNHQVGLRLVAELLRLEHPRVEVFWVRGNHDAESRIVANLLLPDHVHELGLGTVESRELPTLGAVVHGRSYSCRSTFDNLLLTYPAPTPHLFNLGLLHTSADGAMVRDGYAPCGRRELVSKGYQYFALGHAHSPAQLSPRVPVVYSGCLQGRSFSESGPRGAMVVTANAERVERVEHHPLDVVRFGAVRIDVAQLESLDRIAEAVRLTAGALEARYQPLRLVVRLLLDGARGVSCMLEQTPRRRTEALLCASETPAAHVWVESIWGEVPGLASATIRLDDVGHPRVTV